jgi:gamma-glutamyltranspeptidase / glutathione hydrolase
MVLGSPGGPRIITIVLETILNLIDHGMSPQDAVDAPRIHHQWRPDTIYVERNALAAATWAELQGMGYSITQQSAWGAAALITVGPPAGGPSGSPAGSPAGIPPGIPPGSPPGETRDAPDPAAGQQMRPGPFHGAIDPRRPSGLAIGE